MKRLKRLFTILNKYKFVIAIAAIILLLVLNWLLTSHGAGTGPTGGGTGEGNNGTGAVSTSSENKLNLFNSLPKYGTNFNADFAPYDYDQSETPTITVYLINSAGRAEFDSWLENYVYPSDTVFVFTEATQTND